MGEKNQKTYPKSTTRTPSRKGCRNMILGVMGMQIRGTMDALSLQNCREDAHQGTDERIFGTELP